jgi:hypothetical protein
MHRYWYGLFPEDYKEEIYDNRWRSKYGEEISAAVGLLDRYVGRFMQLAEAQNRILVIVSSMGQHANQKLTKEQRQKHSVDYRLEDVRKFVSKLLIGEYSFRIESAMVPQYVLAFRNEKEAASAEMELREGLSTSQGISLHIDRNREIVTISALLKVGGEPSVIRGQQYTYSDLGFLKLEVDDHHSGCHCPEGSLIIYNSSTTTSHTPTIDYLEYAPAMLKHFGIQPADYMKEPSFSF